MERNGGSLNPLFIRSQFQIIKLIRQAWEDYNVSIPYSSGLSFRLWKVQARVRLSASKSQSLIHQVSVSDKNKRGGQRENYYEVSIPYSSGLSFRWWGNNFEIKSSESFGLNPLFIRSQFQIIRHGCLSNVNKSLNPLFIRSQFQMKKKKFKKLKATLKSQSLIHQVSVSDGNTPYGIVIS